LPLPKVSKATKYSPMCWATPSLVEATDPVVRAAIQALWKPRVVSGSAEHFCSPAPGSAARYVLSADPKAFKTYLGAFERLSLELRMMALGLAA